MMWWDHPEGAAEQPGFFEPSMVGEPLRPPPLNPPPPIPGITTTEIYGPKPGDLLLNPLPPGGDTTNTNPLATGLDALVGTLRSQNLYDQANSILVADLFQRNAVRMDPLTGQLRQYADGVLKAAPDAIKFVNANMIPGRPDTLNYSTMLTRFNAPLPANYVDATRVAFFSPGLTTPSFYATEFHADISNTIDHLRINATGGTTSVDSPNSRWVTKFSKRSTEINGITLWSDDSGAMTYRGGSTPERFQNATGIADHEVKEVYGNGDFYSVRTTFSNADGRIVSAADRPTGSSLSDFIDTLTVRTTIRSNLLQKGSLDLFGSVTANVLSGNYFMNEFQAGKILNGQILPNTAPTGLTL
jgi:hypothetical protein